MWGYPRVYLLQWAKQTIHESGFSYDFLAHGVKLQTLSLLLYYLRAEQNQINLRIALKLSTNGVM